MSRCPNIPKTSYNKERSALRPPTIHSTNVHTRINRHAHGTSKSTELQLPCHLVSWHGKPVAGLLQVRSEISPRQGKVWPLIFHLWPPQQINQSLEPWEDLPAQRGTKLLIYQRPSKERYGTIPKIKNACGRSDISRLTKLSMRKKLGRQRQTTSCCVQPNELFLGDKLVCLQEQVRKKPRCCDSVLVRPDLI